jgi:hypothetical protein
MSRSEHTGSWRELAAELTPGQVAELAALERAGARSPGALLVAARRMAADNLEGWL